MGLYGAGQDLLKDAFSGNIKGAKAHARTAKDLAAAEQHDELVFSSLYYLWQIAQRQKQTKMEEVYRERLRFFHSRISSRHPEVLNFEREVLREASK